MDVYARRRTVVVALLFILTMGSMVLDRRAPLLVVMGFFCMGVILCMEHMVMSLRRKG